MFYEKGCSERLRNIHRKTPVLEPLFKKRYQYRCFFREYYITIKSTYFKEHLQTAASAICKSRHWNLGIGIGIGTDIANGIIFSSVRPMDPKLSRVVT